MAKKKYNVSPVYNYSGEEIIVYNAWTQRDEPNTVYCAAQVTLSINGKRFETNIEVALEAVK